jgi:hypothetical protein
VPIRVGLIGYGLGGEVFHAPLVDANPDLRLSTIVTSNPERSARAQARYAAAEVVGTVDDLWERAGDHDLVVVCTPNIHHVPRRRRRPRPARRSSWTCRSRPRRRTGRPGAPGRRARSPPQVFENRG